MKIFPAIDLYEKKAVRLLKGDYKKMTVYSDNPPELAEAFENAGAEFIHIVDLEGAKFGTAPNIDVITEITKNTKLFAEVGGGIRSLDIIDRYIGSGVSRVILGTAAVENRQLLEKALDKYGSKIAVGADVRDGFIAIKGWVQNSNISLADFLTDMKRLGVNNVICTDISKDGAMQGTNLELYSQLSKISGIDITASGGVSSLNDVKRLAGMNLYAAIIGKAYYTGAINLKEAIEAAK